MITLNVYLSMLESEELQQIFEQLYHQYKNLMYQRAYEIVQNTQTAEDIVHESFIKIAKNMHMVNQALPERRKALIMRILENTAIDFYRKNKKDVEYVSYLNAEDSLEYIEETTIDWNLVHAILQMPLQYQQIFYLKYSHGYSNKEIAQLLGITVSKIEKKLSRGKHQLKQYLKEVPKL